MEWNRFSMSQGSMSDDAPAREIFLQDSATKLLLTPDNAWTADRSRARNFKNTLNAVAYALREHLASAQVLLRGAGNRREEIVVPI